MEPAGEAVLLRVFVGEEERHEGRPLYEAIVAQALEVGMAGATVLSGQEGFGPAGYVRSELSVDAGPRLPMVVEIVDTEEAVNRFLPVVSEMAAGGLVTLEAVRAIRYGGRRASAAPSPDTTA